MQTVTSFLDGQMESLIVTSRLVYKQEYTQENI